MKAVILAGGQGMRLLPLTEETPKVLVEIGGKPFLYYLLNNVVKAGFDKIAIVVRFKKEKIKKFLKDYGFEVTLIEQKEHLGTADAIKSTEKFVGNENFVCIHGDNLFSVNDLKQMKIDDEHCYVAGLKHKNPEKYGVLVTDEKKFLVSMPEKPKKFVGDVINAGLYMFTPEIFGAVKKIDKSSRGEFEINDAIMLLAKEKKVKVKKLDDFWLDLGNKEDIVSIESFVREGKHR
ncbi:MAG: sugar phosphate nucleotidyltransferase [Candidatus Woesearchaeota archaeon]|jgi:dTDP-glucose pyrophosphorylase|nr:sugar phosphate nucleotidyltransferase [Candidatus Woesearchaeota archaeon]MDP7610734.1 sugar phosphate nucleotidyltransferase [Candidatus Woesearchaeota archaeon]